MFTKSSLFDLFGDLVVYRGLNVVDRRLPAYREVYAEIGLPGPIPPRKLETDYARALAWLLTRAQTTCAAGRPLALIARQPAATRPSTRSPSEARRSEGIR